MTSSFREGVSICYPKDDIGLCGGREGSKTSQKKG